MNWHGRTRQINQSQVAPEYSDTGGVLKTQTSADISVSQVVPLFSVTDIQRSRRFYVNALGFAMTNQWIDGGKLRWCWLECWATPP